MLDPAVRWFPADEALRESSFEKLLPPLVPELRRQVKPIRQTFPVECAFTLLARIVLAQKSKLDNC